MLDGPVPVGSCAPACDSNSVSNIIMLWLYFSVVFIHFLFAAQQQVKIWVWPDPCGPSVRVFRLSTALRLGLRLLSCTYGYLMLAKLSAIFTPLFRILFTCSPCRSAPVFRSRGWWLRLHRLWLRERWFCSCSGCCSSRPARCCRWSAWRCWWSASRWC